MRYRILSPISHDGLTAAAGECIELTDDQADGLLASGIVELEHRPFSTDSLTSLKQLDTRALEDETGKLSDAFSQLRDAAGVLTGEVQALDKQIAEIRAQRSAIALGHVSKADYLNYLRESFRRRGANYERYMLKAFQGRARGYEFMESAMSGDWRGLILPFLHGDSLDGSAIAEGAIYYLFGEIMVQRFSTLLDGLDWPDKAMPLAARGEALQVLSAELATVEARRDELCAHLEAAGLAH